MMQADAAFAQALAKADKSALEKLLDADFIWTDSRGKVETKAEVLRELPRAAVLDAKGMRNRRRTRIGTSATSR